MAVGNESGTLANGIFDDVVAIGHVVERLVLRPQSLQNLDGVFHAGLRDIDLLESADYAALTGEVAVEFFVGGRADESDVSTLEIGLQHVRGVRTTVACPSCTNHVVDFVDIDDGVSFFLHSVHHLLDAFLEVAAKLGSCQHRTHIHLIDAAPLESFGHFSMLDSCRQSIDKCRLSHTRLAHMQRIVLVFPAKHLYRAFQFLLASDERVVLVNGIIHARHKGSPRRVLLFRLIRRIAICCVVINLFQHFIIRYHRDERGEEHRLIFAKIFVEQKSSRRLFQLHHRIHEMSDINRFARGIHSMIRG